ncbi:diacylglycerol [Stylonychia lemnae]|uniref:diacylglycerol kinase (ATP) n=1 Tax=Stylonychia lemnae TaxID=5949 RepID=A0A077ZUG0_STYLE|nr:diacylglycerol [Stylonychia lemnae]|eukprot:CDW73512.1 diacylglycerol [Stylonychia lemnae]
MEKRSDFEEIKTNPAMGSPINYDQSDDRSNFNGKSSINMVDEYQGSLNCVDQIFIEEHPTNASRLKEHSQFLTETYNQGSSSQSNLTRKTRVEEIKLYQVFLFANPKSGSQQARFFINQQMFEHTFELGKGVQAHLLIHNILDEQAAKSGYAQIASLQREDDPTVRIIMVTAGGDGSLIGIVMKAQEDKKNKVDFDKLLCCPLPYGTGNDLSRILKWGGSPDSQYYKKLDRLIQEICLNSEEQQINLWKVVIKYKEKGATYIVDSKSRKYVQDHDDFKRYMINYFGMGEDGRIGVAFEKNRTKYRCCNNCIYCWAGFKNFLGCCRNQTIAEQIDYMKVLDDDNQESLIDKKEDSLEEEKSMRSTEGIKLNQGGRVVFSTNQKDKDNFRLEGNPISIISTNINSMMGGRRNVWNESRNHIGLKNPYQTQKAPKKPLVQFNNQHFDDDVLEFNSFNTILQMVLTGGYRISQDRGPIQFKFKDLKKDFYAYLNVDGEYYKMRNPDTATVSLATDCTKSGKLRLLARKV